MLYEVLSHIAEELNGQVKRAFGESEDRVVLSNLINPDGSPAVKEDNKLVMSLINISEEKFLMNNNAKSKKEFPSVNLNLYILFSTTFTGNLSSEALKFISMTISFFQGQPVFHVEGNMLVFEIFNASFQELANVWAIIGGKYTPSIIYKVRMIEIDENTPSSTLHRIIQK